MASAAEGGAGTSLLEVRELTVRYRRWFAAAKEGGPTPRRIGGQPGPAVDGVSFALARGETLALVGESGCGKSTLARALLRLVPAAEGSVLFQPTAGGQVLNWLGLRGGELRRRRRHMQMIFQDPGASLDPRRSVRQIVGEPLEVQGVARRLLNVRVGELLERVGLDSQALERLPHEFSGGGKQRIAIARALASEPDFIVCDEALSALDRSMQAQILTLLRELQQDHGVAYLFITHELSVVPWIAYRVAVMYRGRIVESGLGQKVFEEPVHPYTRALLAARPELLPARGGGGEQSSEEPGGEHASRPFASPPNRPRNPGCAYAPRCPLVEERCWSERPEMRAVAGREAACHVAE